MYEGEIGTICEDSASQQCNAPQRVLYTGRVSSVQCNVPQRFLYTGCGICYKIPYTGLGKISTPVDAKEYSSWGSLTLI